MQVVDGWELNGELFPNEGDHPLPIKERVAEFCGKSRWYRGKKIFTSSQNAALLQYRVPLRGRGFVVSARYPKNPRREYNDLIMTLAWISKNIQLRNPKKIYITELEIYISRTHMDNFTFFKRKMEKYERNLWIFLWSTFNETQQYGLFFYLYFIRYSD